MTGLRQECSGWEISRIFLGKIRFLGNGIRERRPLKEIYDDIIHESIDLHNHELIWWWMAIMRLKLKRERPWNQKPVCYQWATTTSPWKLINHKHFLLCNTNLNAFSYEFEINVHKGKTIFLQNKRNLLKDPNPNCLNTLTAYLSRIPPFSLPPTRFIRQRGGGAV